jgi:hypothetical protein
MEKPGCRTLHRTQQGQLTKSKAIRWARIASEQRLTPAQLRLSIVEVADRAATKLLQTGSLPFTASVSPLMSGTDVWVESTG